MDDNTAAPLIFFWLAAFAECPNLFLTSHGGCMYFTLRHLNFMKASCTENEIKFLEVDKFKKWG